MLQRNSLGFIVGFKRWGVGEGWFITCLTLLLGQRLSELTLPLDTQDKSGFFLTL